MIFQWFSVDFEQAPQGFARRAHVCARDAIEPSDRPAAQRRRRERVLRVVHLGQDGSRAALGR